MSVSTQSASFGFHTSFRAYTVIFCGYIYFAGIELNIRAGKKHTHHIWKLRRYFDVFLITNSFVALFFRRNLSFFCERIICMCDAFMIIIIVDLLLLKTHENIAVIKKKKKCTKDRKNDSLSISGWFFTKQNRISFQINQNVKKMIMIITFYYQY